MLAEPTFPPQHGSDMGRMEELHSLDIIPALFPLLPPAQICQASLVCPWSTTSLNRRLAEYHGVTFPFEPYVPLCRPSLDCACYSTMYCSHASASCALTM